MSKSDWLTIGVTLIAIFIGWAVAGQYGPYWAFFCLIVGVAVLVIAHRKPTHGESSDSLVTLGDIYLDQAMPVAGKAKPEAVNVKLTPSTGKSNFMKLEVNNLGPKQNFHAQCRILDLRNDPNGPRKVTLNLAWENIKGMRSMSILRHESRNLLVAEAGYEAQGDLEWIKILGIAEQPWARWPRGQRQNLPEYDIEISIFGDESEHGHTEQFTVRSGMNWALEMVRITHEIWEPDGNAGPRIFLNWDYAPEVAYGAFTEMPRKILMIENSDPTEDALDVRLEDINLSTANRISASMKPIPRIPCGRHVRAEVILKGEVPEGKQGELQMVYFAAGQLRPQFEELTEAEKPKLVRFPMVVRFKDYSRTQYRAHFEFTDDMLVDKQQITFIRREKLKVMQPS